MVTVWLAPWGDLILASRHGGLTFVSVSAASSLSELSSLHDGGNTDFRHTYQTVQMKALPPITDMDDRSLRAAPPRQSHRVRRDRINQSDDELDRRYNQWLNPSTAGWLGIRRDDLSISNVALGVVTEFKKKEPQCVGKCQWLVLRAIHLLFCHVHVWTDWLKRAISGIKVF